MDKNHTGDHFLQEAYILQKAVSTVMLSDKVQGGLCRLDLASIRKRDIVFLIDINPSMAGGTTCVPLIPIVLGPGSTTYVAQKQFWIIIFLC